MNKKTLKKLNITKDDAPIIVMHGLFVLFVAAIITGSIAGYKQVENDKNLDNPRLNAAIDSLETHKFHYGTRRDNAVLKYNEVREQVLAEQKSKTK